MALSAYELLVIVRAQNMASGQLRSVARDLRALGASGGGAASNLKQINNQRWNNLSRGGAIMRDTGRSARLMGLGVGLGMGIAANAAADFNTEVTLAATQTGRASKSMTANIADIGRNTAVISQGILKQMDKFPASSQEMTAAAYEIFSSLDVSLTGGVRLLNVFNKAAVAGQTELAEVTKAGTTVLNDFFQNTQTPARDMTMAFERMFAAVRFGRMTFAEFAQSMNTTVPAAKAADQSLDTLTGTMAFLTRRMPNVRMAGTSLARLFEIFGRKKMVDNLKAVGVSITDASGRMLQLPEIMTRVTKKFPELARGGQKLRSFFKEFSGTEGTIMARRAFVFLAKDMDLYRQMLHLVVTDNTEFQRSFAALSQTSGVKWKVFLNRLKADLIRFGQAVLPAIQGLAGPIEKLIGWFEGLDNATKRTIGRWAVYGAVIAVLGGTLLTLGGGILNLIGILGRFGILGAGFLGFFVRIGAVLAIAQVAFGQTGHQIDLLGKAFEGLKNILSNFFAFATSGWQGMLASGAGVFLLTKRMANVRAGMLRQAGREVTTGGILSTMLWGVGGMPGFRRQAQVAEREMAKVESAAVARTVRRQQTMNRAGKVFVRAGSMEGLKAAETQSGRISRYLGLAASAAVALPGSLKIAAGALGLGAAAAALWYFHTRGARKEAERIKREMAVIGQQGQAARGLASFGLDERNMQRAHLNVRIIRREIGDLKQEISKATPGARPMLRDQLAGLKLDLADAMAIVDESHDRMRKSFQAVGVFTNRFTQTQMAVGRQQQIINRLQGEFNKVAADKSGSEGVFFHEQRLKNLGAELQRQKGNLANMVQFGRQQWGILQQSFDKALRDLGQTDVAFKIHPTVELNEQQIRKDLLGAVTLLRGVTPGQLKLLIAAELDPSKIAQLPAKLRAALQTARKERLIVEAEVHLKQDTKRKMQTALAGARRSLVGTGEPGFEFTAKFSDIKGAAATTRRQAAAPFKKAIFQKVSITPPGNGRAIGAKIMADVHAGVLSAGGPNVVVSGIVNIFKNTYEQVIKLHESGSPSKLYMREGKNIINSFGIGALESAGMLQKNIVASFEDMFSKVRQVNDVQIALLSGSYLQKMEENIKPLTKIQEGRLADLQAKIDAGKKLSHAQMASMHALERRQRGRIRVPDLAKDVEIQLSALRKYNNGIAQLAGRGVPVEILNQLRALGIEGAKYINMLANASDRDLNRVVRALKNVSVETERANSLSLGDYITGVRAGNDEIAHWEQGIRRLKAAHVDTRVIDYFIQKGLSGYQELATFLAARGTPAFQKYVQEIVRGNRLITASNFHTRAEMVAAQQEMWNSARNAAHAALVDIYNMFVQIMGAIFSNIRALANIADAMSDPFAGFDDAMQTSAAGISQAADVGSSAISDAQDSQEQAIQRQRAIDDAWQAEHDRLQSVFGELFGGPVAQELQGFTMDMDDLIADLQAQVDAFREWRNSLDTLAGRGVPQEMLDQLEALGPDAAGNIATLAGASDADLKRYIALWRESQSLIDGAIDQNKVQEAAMQGMSDAATSVADSVGAMNESITELVPTMADLLSAQQKNTTSLVTWAQDLATLAGRHIPRELLADIMEQGPQAAAAVHLLATSSDADLNTFVTSWTTARDTLAGINADILALTDPEAILQGLRDQNAAFEDFVGDLTTVRENLIRNGVTPAVADKIIAGLRDLGPEGAGFIKALTTMSDPQLQEFVTLWKTRQAEIDTATKEQFTRQIAMWRTHGQNIAIALVNGVADEQQILEAWFTNLFKSLLISGSAPSPPASNPAGPSTPPDVRDARSGTGPGSRPTGSTASAVRGGGGSGGTTVHMNVTASSTESLDTTLARASYRLRNTGLT